MHDAVVGDDVFGEDSTVNALQERVAKLFHKEAALFCPSGTMCNLLSLLVWCDRRDAEVIVGDKSHMFLFEQGGAAQFGGISVRPLPNLKDGTMSLEAIRMAIRECDIHEPVTRLICVENTHNACGGMVLPLEYMAELKKFGLPVHLDGARVWNALTAYGVAPHVIAQYVDSLTVCLSKGLGAPVGSLLIGTSDFIERAKRVRKALGGGMRQSGILAAAGMVAINDFEKGILLGDHAKAAELAKCIRELGSGGGILSVAQDAVHTNIIFVKTINDASAVAAMLKSDGILVSVWEPNMIRMVLHRDVSDEDIKRTICSLKKVGGTRSRL